MNFGLWQRVKHRGVKDLGQSFMARVVELLRIPPPEASQLIDRISFMERDIMLLVKAAAIAMLVYAFYSKPWMEIVLGALEIGDEPRRYFFWVYVGLNLVSAALLVNLRRFPLAVIQEVVFATCLVDGIFLASLTLVTGGYDSILFWLFIGLIIRGAVSVPRASSQIMLNLTLIASYIIAGLIDLAIVENLSIAATDYESRRTMEFFGPIDNAAEPLLMRLLLLLRVAGSCFGVEGLLERQRRAAEEAREFALREGQLRSAGRLAAEFAHQIKNPLAIINNAAFSVQRALKEGKAPDADQIQIIQEEVERSDRIITQIMGYAQLSEGRVEKLSVIEELETAIEQVFPPAASYPVKIHRHYAADFPPLLMHRRHVTETFGNLLQNAREAFDGRAGNLYVSARTLGDYSIEVTIRDEGPGIPPDKQEKIFEAYYTTKEKGTGLGLATVKHNVELYGGTVRLESQLGKGATFVVVFPARTPTKLTKNA